MGEWQTSNWFGCVVIIVCGILMGFINWAMVHAFRSMLCGTAERKKSAPSWWCDECAGEIFIAEGEPRRCPVDGSFLLPYGRE